MRLNKNEEYKRTFIAEILEFDPAFLDRFPIEAYLSELTCRPASLGYGYIPSSLNRVFKDIGSTYGKSALSLYHKLALSELVSQNSETLRYLNFPESVRDQYRDWFERVFRDFAKRNNGFYSLENSSFRKDLAVCSFKMIPVGAGLVEVFRIPRKFLVQRSLRQLIKGMHLVLYRTQGFRPFYFLHTDRRYMKEFTQEGWNDTYYTLSELLKANRDIRGVLGASWYYDPNLENVSPELSYLKREPVSNGAQLFRMAPSEAIIRDATTWSATRRALYKKGKYLPTSYLLVWPRKDLIAWANKNQRNYTNCVSGAKIVE